MIDLKEIEREIDELLAKETTETLRQWLQNQNEANVYSYLGQGDFIDTNINDISCIVETNTHKPGITDNCEGDYTGFISYSKAA